MGEMRTAIQQETCCVSACEFTCPLGSQRLGGEFPLVLQAAADAETDVRMDLDGQVERIRYITETCLDRVIGIVGQYLECFDRKSRFKLLHYYICVSKLPNFWENKWWMR